MHTAASPSEAAWSLAPGIGALLSSTAQPLACSPGWQALMQVPQWRGDWREGLDSASRERLLQGLSQPRDFATELSLSRAPDNASRYRCNGWWDAARQAHGCYLVDITTSQVTTSDITTSGTAAGGIGRPEAPDQADWIRELFAQLPIQLAYFSPPPDVRCLYANRGYAQAMGHDERSILGRSIEELLTPEELGELRETGRSFAQGGQAMSLLVSRRPREKLEVFEVSVIADRWPDGGLRGTFALITNVTERHLAESGLLASRERLSRFMEASAEAVIFHRQGIITDLNPAACRLLGQSHAELVGRSVVSLTAPQHRERSRAAIDSGADAYFETEVQQASGERVPVELLGRTMELQGERLRMTVMRDIRDRRQAQARIHTLIEDLRSQKDRAEAADRAKSVFLAAASHDLRQPIHALGLFLTSLRAMAQASSVPHAELSQICRRMQASLDGLSQLLNMLLDVSRLDANAVQIERARIPLAQLFVELDQEFADLARTKGLRLSVSSSAAWIYTDGTVLRRILSNLMSNAIRYAQRGHVLLGARRRPGHMEIQVWDQGIGIAPEQLEAIFEEFFQIDPPRPERAQSHGLGLGLSIVRRSARLLDAPLRVHSVLGRGSMFSITVPIAEAPSPDSWPARAPDTSMISYARRARRVLVIDDEEQVLLGMQQLLQVWGHQVWCASTADEAVVLAIEHAEEIDLLLSDYRLGGNVTAVQAIAAVHACLPAPVPTYILTGDTSPQRIQQAGELGFPLLHKPVDPTALRSILIA
jgi:PAS domain S-box-containing protein